MTNVLETAMPTTAATTVPDAIRHERSAIVGRKHRIGRSRRGLVWVMRLAVAGPAAYVSLLHVHTTATHFGQSGPMGWAEAVGMEAVTALALMELDEDNRAHRTTRETALPWALLVAAVLMSLGSNVFAVLQQGAESRSFGGVVYGAWPTLAFLAVAWLWHRQARRDSEQSAAVVQLVDDEGQDVEEDAVIPDQRGKKRRDAEDAVRLDLMLNRTPVPAEIARRAGVSPQYAGRIIKALEAEAA